MEFKFQTKFEFKQWRRKTKQKKRKEEKASQPSFMRSSAQPARPATGPALHFSPSAGPCTAASRPGLTACSPRSQLARRPCPRASPLHLQPLPPGPRASATPSHRIVFLPTPIPSPTKPRPGWQVRARGHAGSMTLSPPWRHAHATSAPTTPARDAVRCQRRITSRPPLELGAWL